VADDDPRDVLRSIAYGADPRISPSDRVRAIEQLTELERSTRSGARVDDLTPDQVLEQLDSLREALPGMVAVARVAAGVEVSHAVEPPEDVADVAEALELALRVNELLEARVAELERALQRVTVHRRLGPAVPAVTS
jgi:hypothetical protein